MTTLDELGDCATEVLDRQISRRALLKAAAAAGAGASLLELATPEAAEAASFTISVNTNTNNGLASALGRYASAQGGPLSGLGNAFAAGKWRGSGDKMIMTSIQIFDGGLYPTGQSPPAGPGPVWLSGTGQTATWQYGNWNLLLDQLLNPTTGYNQDELHFITWETPITIGWSGTWDCVCDPCDPNCIDSYKRLSYPGPQTWKMDKLKAGVTGALNAALAKGVAASRIWCSIWQEPSTNSNFYGRGHCGQYGGCTDPTCCNDNPCGNFEADPRAVDYRDYYVAVLDAVAAASSTINTTFYGGTWTECGSCTWGNETILPLLAAVDPGRTKLNSTNRQLDVQGYPFGFSTGGTSPVDLTTMQAKVRPQLTTHGYPANTKIYVNGYNREYVGTPICNTDDGCSAPFDNPGCCHPYPFNYHASYLLRNPLKEYRQPSANQNISVAAWYTFDLAPDSETDWDYSSSMITTTFGGFPPGPCGGGWGGTNRPDLVNPAYAAVQILQKLRAGTRLTRTISGGAVPDGYEVFGVRFTAAPKRAFALIVNDTYAHHDTPTVTFTNLSTGMGWANGTVLRKFVQRIDERSYSDGVGLEAPYSLGTGTVSGGSISVSLPTTDLLNGVQPACLCSAPAHSVRLVWVEV